MKNSYRIRNDNYGHKFRKSITRYGALKISVIIICGYIGFGLINLQVRNHTYYSESAKSGSHRLVEEQAPRGNIISKDGEILAYDKQMFALTFTEAEESTDKFYETMEKVIKILKENNLDIDDDFPIKLNGDNYEFQFNAVDEEGRKLQERQFKIDISLMDSLSQKKYQKDYSKLNDKETKKIIKEAEKYTAKDTYDFLTSKDMYDVPTGVYSKEDERRMVVVKYAIKLQSYSGYKPVTIASSLDRDVAFVFEQQLESMPGINIETKPQRCYPFNKIGAAFIGYVSKVNDDEKNEEKGYDASTDIKGSSGIEEAFEDRLRGSKGATIVEVNRFGRPISELAKRESYQGQNVHLTVDWKVQQAAEKALEENMKKPRYNTTTHKSTQPDRGAVVALNAKTGEVIAMVSQPTFDPNDFAEVNGLSTEKYNEYYGFTNEFYENFVKEKGWSGKTIVTSDPSNSLNGKTYLDGLFPMNENGQREDLKDMIAKPMVNYATQSLIPPGSTFKTFTAYAGLNEGVINETNTIKDAGFYDDGDGFNRPFPEDGYLGNMNITSALAKSSNAYFMETSKRLYTKYKDVEKTKSSDEFKINYTENGIAAYAWRFGIGADPEDDNAITSTGIEISENFGQVYNHYSAAESQAPLIYINIVNRLKEGKYTEGKYSYTYPYFNLSLQSDDLSEEVKKLRQEARDVILGQIKTGNFDEDVLIKLFKKINANDPLYKGRTISNSEYTSLMDFMKGQIISNGYTQITAKFNSYNAAIGQGLTNVTPLELASAYATYANGGTRYKVHLLDKITDADGNVVFEQQPEILDEVDLDKSIMKTINEGLKQVISGNAELNSIFSNLGVTVAGKTGTATFDNDQASYDREAYGWLATFAPADDPEIVVVSVVFNGHFGKENGSINYAVMDAYFNGNKNDGEGN
ncbi:penicillin-binding protein transpeptidase [Clostridium bornimense]|uniref:Penicillin-binding protein transpeptidase n=1 Tax=Clostridium bornimense TaxID=1216932 RepID=W6RZU4_9CLOT|nr:penicillin-binding transpeptidase domain-containing protein [Clostridium bornimense]CDM70181.1 penicillin-binding protein transpeptidase [Clostridium bornimense]